MEFVDPVSQPASLIGGRPKYVFPSTCAFKIDELGTWEVMPNQMWGASFYKTKFKDANSLGKLLVIRRMMVSMWWEVAWKMCVLFSPCFKTKTETEREQRFGPREICGHGMGIVGMAIKWKWFVSFMFNYVPVTPKDLEILSSSSSSPSLSFSIFLLVDFSASHVDRNCLLIEKENPTK